MSCSYCQSPFHRICDCATCSIDRAIGIINNKQDPLANKRKSHIRKNIERDPHTWFMEDGMYPSDANWDSIPLYNLAMRKNITAEFLVIMALRNLEKLFKPASQSPEIENLTYCVMRYVNDTTDGNCYIRIDNENGKLVFQTYTYDEGEPLYQRYMEQLRQLNDRRGQFIIQRRNENFNQYIERTRSELYLSQTPIEAEECSICLGSLGRTNRIVLRCGHQYCNDCILAHYSSGPEGTRCPCCRREYTFRIPEITDFDFESEEEESHWFFY